MKLISKRSELESYLRGIRKKDSKTGFVPTMGALHEGHLHLIRKSVADNDLTVVSVFVNRLQFNNKSDYDNYPISREKDLEMLEKAGCDVAFFPTADEMFPSGHKKISLDISSLEKVLEGPLRPGHFDGVIQVVYRLFDYVRPDKAYFGLKDYQQCLVVKHLRNHFFPSINLEFCPVVRHGSGLAMSSRNERLTPEGKNKAAAIYKTLSTIQSLSKHIEAQDALKYGRHLLDGAGIETEYLELAHADTLIPGNKWFKKGKNAVLTAVYVDGVRLIDNIVF